MRINVRASDANKAKLTVDTEGLVKGGGEHCQFETDSATVVGLDLMLTWAEGPSK